MNVEQQTKKTTSRTTTRTRTEPQTNSDGGNEPTGELNSGPDNAQPDQGEQNQETSSPNQRYINLQYILDEEQLKVLDALDKKKLKKLFNDEKSKNSEATSSTPSSLLNDEDLNIFKIQEAIKVLVNKAHTNYLDNASPTLQDMLPKLAFPVFEDKITFEDEFTQKIPEEISAKDKILLLMLYMLHNTHFDE